MYINHYILDTNYNTVGASIARLKKNNKYRRAMLAPTHCAYNIQLRKYILHTEMAGY